jgi:hypothetical protein
MLVILWSVIGMPDLVVLVNLIGAVHSSEARTTEQ